MPKSQREGTSVGAASAALIKAVVGTGIFALPPAIRASGILLGSAMSIFMGLVSLYTTWAMVEAVRELRRRGHAKDTDGRIEYTDVTALYSPRWEAIMTVLCVLGQCGSALGYFAFICDSVQPLVTDWLTRPEVFGLTALIEAPLILLRNTSHPAFESAMAFGNVAVALALGTVLWGVAIAPPAASAHPAMTGLTWADSDGIGLLFGVTLIMFSCHLEAVSIEADMAHRESFDWVMNATFAALMVLFVGFGVAVYANLGEATGRSFVHGRWHDVTIMQNLQDGPFVGSVKALMALNLVAMMPITLLPASRAAEQLVRAESMHERAAVRLCLLGALALAAAAFPHFETIVGLTGALGGATCFTLPALCYAHFCRERLLPWQLCIAYAVALFGIIGTLWSFAQQIAP